ncbi:hypothetical protein NPIL_156461 [Nephila pilipes]|uniref:Uncharacterized protein n=1 Tax=Nephila pilipes TaxID=299642 RepID=A0A8X6PT64_NEPPI|nr:hypothetical protein NPIL_156461 [Nephila pilipes]
MDSTVKRIVKLSHKQFRAMLKKFRRKKKRQQLAKEREQQELLEQQRRENSPSFKEREEDRRRNAQLFDEFEERERMREHNLWLLREQKAQEDFKKKQELQEQMNKKFEEERKKIVAEFEHQQYLEHKKEEEHEKIKSQKEEALQEALSNLERDDGPWHNPIAPGSYIAGVEREQCQFFVKTGCCRFGDRCSRGHSRPSVSTTILIRGMYSHFSIGQTQREDFDTDNSLEYEDKERYEDFKNFYYDVLPEFKKFGKVVQFKVCNNHEVHLRGNVYVQFSNEEEAVKAYQAFNGRYYAGKQLTCEFTNVIKWRSAICGLFFRKLCPKGINCNFLHVFKNPTHEFWEADRDLQFYENNGSHSSRSNQSRSRSERKSYRSHSSERRRHRRDASPEYKIDNYSNHSYHRDRSIDSENDAEENGRVSSSRKKHSERRKHSPHRLHHRKRHRDSRSRSKSLTPMSDDSLDSKHSHKRRKHKKKKSKKSKREKKDDRSDD